jgi:hypothetical protein
MKIHCQPCPVADAGPYLKLWLSSRIHALCFVSVDSASVLTQLTTTASAPARCGFQKVLSGLGGLSNSAQAFLVIAFNTGTLAETFEPFKGKILAGSSEEPLHSTCGGVSLFVSKCKAGIMQTSHNIPQVRSMNSEDLVRFSIRLQTTRCIHTFT